MSGLTPEREQEIRRIRDEARAWKDAVMPWSAPFSDAVADGFGDLLAEIDRLREEVASLKVTTGVGFEYSTGHNPGLA